MPPRCARCNRFYFPIDKGCQNPKCSSYGQVLSGTPPSSEMRRLKSLKVTKHSAFGKKVPNPANLPPKISPAKNFTPIPSPSIPSTNSTSVPKKEHWRERKARLERERAQKKLMAEKRAEQMVAEMDKKFPAISVSEGPEMFFRACGKGQEPWDLFKTNGFEHRKGRKTAAELKKYLAKIYSKEHGGAKTYMALYRANSSNNPADAPFISAGKKASDAQGASNAYWQYAIEIKGLKEIKVTEDLLGDKETTLSEDVESVRLLIDGDNFDTATTRVLLHGPLPECTWLGGTTITCIKAWLRLGGPPWQQQWRPFSLKVVDGVKNLANEYGVDISQPG